MPWPYPHLPGLSQISRVSVESCAPLDLKKQRYQAHETLKIWCNVVIETFSQKFNSEETATKFNKKF